MSNSKYLYLIKTVDDNKVQLVSAIESNDGVTMFEGRICAVLKRYTPPIDMTAAMLDMQKFSGMVLPPVRQNKSKICKDHLGNEFANIFQMCSYYRVSESKYRSRIAHGWTLEEALTGIRKHKQVTDHLGNVFDSKSDMCQFYGISVSAYTARINAGKSLEEALLGISEDMSDPVEDHLGNKFKNITQMCKSYGVRLDSFYHRKRRGWSLEEILTGKKKSTPVTDHTGKTYPDLNDMCAEYAVRPDIYQLRIKRGWTIEEALTGVKKDSITVDHLGNIYTSQKEMCTSYGIKVGTFRERIRNGWTVEEALTVDIGKSKVNDVFDHLGNAYSTIKDMCDFYGVKLSTYRSRLKNGYTLEEALTGKKKAPSSKTTTKSKPTVPTTTARPAPVKRKKKSKYAVEDHLGNSYSSTLEMCQAYGIRVDTYKYRIKKGMSLEEALTKTPSMVTTNIQCKDHLGNAYNSQVEMARAYGLTKEQFIARKRSGWDVERILTTPIGTSKGKKFMYQGVEYESRKDFCAKNNLNYDVFIHKTNSGLSVEEAILAMSRVRKHIEPIDHKGTIYDTLQGMCFAYGITVPAFKYRYSRGWSIKDILTTPQKSPTTRPQNITDHQGRTYSSITEMCSAYGVKVATYNYRIANGWSIEDALTTPLNGGIKKKPEPKFRCYDHKGNGYKTKKEMCATYGISTYVFKRRLADGLTLEAALETPTSERKFAFRDHNGVEYTSLKDMCAYWHISVHTYQKRISGGFSIEKALTTPDDANPIKDHKGITYPTIQAMCDAYQITISLFNSRIRRGKELAEALETPVEDLSVVYHGKKYPSLKVLAESHGLNAGTLRSRIKLGWSIEEAVTGIKQSRACCDHLGKQYRSQKEMCEAYNIPPATYQARIKMGWTVEQALLNISPNLGIASSKKTKPIKKKHHKQKKKPAALLTKEFTLFSDEFFRFEKIGVVARKTIEHLLSNDLLPADEYDNISSKVYCMEHLGCEFPLFVYSKDDTVDHNGVNRYYAKPFVHNGKEYYICSQWYEGDRKRLVPWLRRFL